jgi:hypothetical protein
MAARGNMDISLGKQLLACSNEYPLHCVIVYQDFGFGKDGIAIGLNIRNSL